MVTLEETKPLQLKAIMEEKWVKLKGKLVPIMKLERMAREDLYYCRDGYEYWRVKDVSPTRDSSLRFWLKRLIKAENKWAITWNCRHFDTALPSPLKMKKQSTEVKDSENSEEVTIPPFFFTEEFNSGEITNSKETVKSEVKDFTKTRMINSEIREFNYGMNLSLLYDKIHCIGWFYLHLEEIRSLFDRGKGKILSSNFSAIWLTLLSSSFGYASHSQFKQSEYYTELFFLLIVRMVCLCVSVAGLLFCFFLDKACEENIQELSLELRYWSDVDYRDSIASIMASGSVSSTAWMRFDGFFHQGTNTWIVRLQHWLKYNEEKYSGPGLHYSHRLFDPGRTLTSVCGYSVFTDHHECGAITATSCSFMVEVYSFILGRYNEEFGYKFSLERGCLWKLLVSDFTVLELVTLRVCFWVGAKESTIGADTDYVEFINPVFTLIAINNTTNRSSFQSRVVVNSKIINGTRICQHTVYKELNSLGLYQLSNAFLVGKLPYVLDFFHLILQLRLISHFLHYNPVVFFRFCCGFTVILRWVLLIVIHSLPGYLDYEIGNDDSDQLCFKMSEVFSLNLLNHFTIWVMVMINSVVAEHMDANGRVELAGLQEREVGEVTTVVVMVAATLLKRANELIQSKIYPTFWVKTCGKVILLVELPWFFILLVWGCMESSARLLLVVPKRVVAGGWTNLTKWITVAEFVSYDLNSTEEEREFIKVSNRRNYEILRRQCRRLLKRNSENFKLKLPDGGSGSSVHGRDSPGSEDDVSAWESLSSKGRSLTNLDLYPEQTIHIINSSGPNSFVECEGHSAITNFDPSEFSESDSSVEEVEGQFFLTTEGSEENDLNTPKEDAASTTEVGYDTYTTEDFATRQRIIRVEAVRANSDWIVYSPNQAAVSEGRARCSAEAVRLKDFEHLEPCRIFHAARLVAILEAYALYDAEIGYCQGMGDLLSPIIAVIEEDHEAFWCFVGFMRKARHNFRLDEVGVRRQLNLGSRIIKSKDSHLFRHLEKLQAEECFFVYRMVVVLFGRELTFVQTVCIWEVMWADQAALRAGIGKSSWGRIRQIAPPTDDLLLYIIAAYVLQRRKLIIEKNSSMDEIMMELYTAMTEQLEWSCFHERRVHILDYMGYLQLATYGRLASIQTIVMENQICSFCVGGWLWSTLQWALCLDWQITLPNDTQGPYVLVKVRGHVGIHRGSSSGEFKIYVAGFIFDRGKSKNREFQILPSSGVFDCCFANILLTTKRIDDITVHNLAASRKLKPQFINVQQSSQGGSWQPLLRWNYYFY